MFTSTQENTYIPNVDFLDSIYVKSFQGALLSQIGRFKLTFEANQKTDYDIIRFFLSIMDIFNNVPTALLFTHKGIESLLSNIFSNQNYITFVMGVHCEFITRMSLSDSNAAKNLPNDIHTYLMLAFPAKDTNSLLPAQLLEQFEPSFIEQITPEFLKNNYFLITFVFFQIFLADLVENTKAQK